MLDDCQFLAYAIITWYDDHIGEETDSYKAPLAVSPLS